MAGLQVLVVEDDPRIAALLVKGLRARAHDVHVEGTAAGALAHVAAGGVEAVLLDLGLPDLDGLELLRHLAGLPAPPPVVVVTARSDPADRERAAELGAVAYLTKPFAWADLWAAVDGCAPRT